MKRRVVVTGLGTVTSLACQVDELWDRLLRGESGIHPLRVIDTERFKVTFGGDVYDWNPEAWAAAFVEKPDSFTEKKEIKRLDRFSQFAMVAGWRGRPAIGTRFLQEDPFRCGVILGSGIGGLHEIEEGSERG
jgi:3-oxoacyl-[acyl-carrier-protein] synthase II